MTKSAALLTTLMVLVACSQAKDPSSSQIQEVKKQNEEISQEIEEIRESDHLISRSLKMENLIAKDLKFSARVSAASLYFKSFNFDNQKTKDAKLISAANDFTTHIPGIYEEINLKRMSPTKDGKSHSSEQAFYALALTMHMNHHYQNNFLDASADSKGISFYDVIKKAISRESSGENLAEHEEVLMSGMNKEILIELIKARVDIMSAMALKNLTDKRDMTFGQKVKAFLFKLSGGRLGAIELPETFTKANEPTKKQTIGYLTAAIKAKSFLDKQGIEKDLEKSLKSTFSKIKLGEMPRDDLHADNVVENGETKEDADQRRIEIKSLIDGLLQ